MLFRTAIACSFFVLAWEFPVEAANVKSQPSTCQFADDVADCKARLDEFTDNVPKANRGDYLAQREVAFCYSTGCRGAVTVDMVKACTWQTVIMETKKSDNTDAFNYRYQCELLTADDRNAAKSAAAALFTKIYKKPMSKALPYEGSPKS